MLLSAGQQVQVGRTQWADFSVEGDEQMSRVHFALETDQTACYLRDLGSSSGTHLNGEPLQGTAVVRNGDRIRAGRTVFVIHTEGDAPEKAAELRSTVVPGSGPAASRADAVAGQGPDRVPCTAETCASGLVVYRGSVEDIRPHVLAAKLATSTPLWLIVDFGKLDVPRPEGLDEPAYLLDFLPEETREKSSPVVLSAAEGVDLFGLVDAGWGKDAVVALYSDAAAEDVLDQLRSATGAYVRPGLTLPQLTQTASVFAENVFSELTAALVEGPSPEEWNVIAREEFGPTLESLGFDWQAEEPGAEDAPPATTP